MTAEVKRIYPESKSGLINWIEENFHEIDEFIAVFELKDGTQMMAYDTFTYRGALGSLEMAKESLHQLALNDEFIPKER
ncbi:hypothetical protein [Gorillibacterium sp. CAU 1737]|uniref:hypothetical protein n=1 Tax=Gorillibacterium sp. CAU 1737 TaxID=3140362 RepID=UPI00326012FF